MSSLTDDNPVQWDIVESDAAGLTEDEAYQLLSGALPAQIFGTPLAAASKPNAGHTGGMIALVPSDPERLAVAGGEPEEQLHLTLAFLGEASEISEQARQQILDAARRYAGGPIEANAFSINVFNPGGTSDGKEACVVLGVGNAGPELVDLQSSVVSSLRGMSGFKLPEQHNPWVPHITLAYTDDFTKLRKWADRVGPVTFDKLRVAFGDEVTDIPLGDELTAAFWKSSDHPRSRIDGRFVESGTGGSGFDERAKSAARSTSDVTKAIPASTSAGAKLPSEDRGALRDYTSGVGDYVNDGLRQHKGKASKVTGEPGAGSTKFLSTENVQAGLAGLDRVMANSKTDRDIAVSRGIHSPETVFGDLWNENDVTGLTWTDYGFVSASPDRNQAMSYAKKKPGSVMMNVLVPKGTGAATITVDLDDGHEQTEVLLDRGRRFRVVRDNGIIDGVRQLDVEVL